MKCSIIRVKVARSIEFPALDCQRMAIFIYNSVLEPKNGNSELETKKWQLLAENQKMATPSWKPKNCNSELETKKWQLLAGKQKKWQLRAGNQKMATLS